MAVLPHFLSSLSESAESSRRELESTGGTGEEEKGTPRERQSSGSGRGAAGERQGDVADLLTLAE